MENNLPADIKVSESQLTQRFQDQDFHYGTGDEEGHHLRDYWYTLLKRKWWVVGVFLGVVIATGLAVFLIITPTYRAACLLQIVQDNPSALLGEKFDPLSALSSSDDVLSRFYETQYRILSSRSIAYNIIDHLDLMKHPEYKSFVEGLKDKSPEAIRSKLADLFLTNLEINPMKKSYLVEVAYLAADKELAQNVTETIQKEYLNFSMTTRQQSYAIIKDWLDNQLQQIADKVVDSERKVVDYGKKKNFLVIEAKDEVIASKYIELSKLLIVAESQRAGKEAEYTQIKEKGLDAPTITANTLIQQLRASVITQEGNVSSIQKIYGQNYPPLQAERAKLEELRLRLSNEVKRIRNSVEADYQTALRTEKLLKEQFESQKTTAMALQDNLIKHHIFKRDMETNEQLYQALLSRMKEANVSSTMVAANVSVIEPAELPLRPHAPKKMLSMVLAAFAGLMGGIGMAFIMEYFDDSIKSSEELESVCRLPSLGLIPFFLGKGDEPKQAGEASLALATFTDPMSSLAEAIHHVSTSIMLSLSGGPPVAIMVTSPSPSEGKTTVSINLSSSLAMDGRKVVLLDTDMRKPKIHKAFQEPVQPGLSNYLSGGASLAGILRPTIIPNLYLITAGTTSPNPFQLLNSQAFKNLVQELRKDFQHIVFDTPPIVGFADGRTISGQSDGVLVVFKHQATSRNAARLAMQLLNQVNSRILGGVLNMAQFHRLGYGKYYGYHKYYGKYYKHYGDNN
jgi:succinoglycan biosynthesis transport protein ExoP